jgi:hypothetical protein
VTREIVGTTDAPDAIGPYSLAVRADVVRTSRTGTGSARSPSPTKRVEGRVAYRDDEGDDSGS